MSYNPIYMNANSAISDEEVAAFKRKHMDLNEEIQAALRQGKRSPIGDGVFHFEGYLKAKVKILWLMKEPYDTEKGENVEDIETGGHYFAGSEMYTKRVFGRDRTTWYPIMNASHAILTGQTTWDQSYKADKNTVKKFSDVLSHIAYINIQKLPSLTREQTDNGVIQKAFVKNIEWVQKQIDLLKPDVIIGANTLNDNVFVHFGLKGNHINLNALPNTYLVNDRLFIRTKHPAQRAMKKDAYINEILKSVTEWRNKVN